jgi:excisionase family DNA binding protein
MPYAPRTNKRYYSVSELADLLNIHPETVDAWIKRGRLPPPVRPGGPRSKRYWPREQIERLLAELNSAAS